MSRNYPCLLVSNGRGDIFEIPELEMAGMISSQPKQVAGNELISLPYGSNLFELPGRYPIGFNKKLNKFVTVRSYEGKPVTAVAAFLAPAYTQTLRAAFESKKNAPRLPLFAFTAVGWYENAFYVPAIRVDKDIRQDPAQFNERLVEENAQVTLEKYPGNRLVEHLVNHCVRCYHCPAAQNFVLGRWEAPVPTSPSCNAQCIGCISRQTGSGVPVTQERLNFVPTVDEITEFAVPHLQQAPRPVISFGQGCEGEPLLQTDLIEQAIRAIRRKTPDGTINLNSNGCYPGAIARLCQAGLDSARISMNSARPELYRLYYSPKDFDFADVIESIRVLRKNKRWISLNYFIFPGLTDHPDEIEALLDIVKEHRIDYIQMRNLNIDPEWYIAELSLNNSDSALGIGKWMQTIKSAAPWLRFGYFNPPKEEW